METKNFRIIFKDGRELTVKGTGLEYDKPIVRIKTDDRESAAFYFNHSELLAVVDEDVIISDSSASKSSTD